jgi:hypothetical protein
MPYSTKKKSSSLRVPPTSLLGPQLLLQPRDALDAYLKEVRGDRRGPLLCARADGRLTRRRTLASQANATRPGHAFLE